MDPAEAVEVDVGDLVEAPPERDPSQPITIRLRKPIKLGSQLLEEITLRYSSGALKGFTIATTPDGALVVNQHALLSLGVKLAGHPSIVADKFTDPRDVAEVVAAAMGFIS